MTRSSKWSPSFSPSHPNQNPISICSHVRAHPPNPPGHCNVAKWGLQNMKLLIMQFSPFSSYFFLLGPIIFLSILLFNTLCLCSLTWQMFCTHLNQKAQLFLHVFLLLEVIHINRIQPRHLQFADEDLATVKLNLNNSKGHNKSKSCTKT